MSNFDYNASLAEIADSYEDFGFDRDTALRLAREEIDKLDK